MNDPDFEEQLRQENIAKIEEEEKNLGDRTYTDADGTVFEWDAEKKAWFPKIDDNFIAQYQMNYGVEEPSSTSKETSAEETAKYKQEYDQYCRDYYNYYYGNNQNQPGVGTEEGEKDGKEKTGPGGDNSSEFASYDDYYNYYAYYYGQSGESESSPAVENQQKEPDSKAGNDSAAAKAGQKRPGEQNKTEGWFDVDNTRSTQVYVSGLPSDVTLDEFKDLMSKCGLIMYDNVQKGLKLKLYRDSNGEPKGDGLCGYIKPESVELALQIIDGSDVRGNTIHVERAKFEMKGDYDPSKKRKKLSNKEKRKLKQKQEKLFDWRPERPVGARFKHEKVVVLKNMFDPHEFDENPLLINEVRDDVKSECSKSGDVKKVTIYDRHPDGVVMVTMKEAEEADACVEALNGRWFAKRRLLAATWDGVTKYEVEETEAERDARLKKWENFLTTADSSSEPPAKSESAPPPPPLPAGASSGCEPDLPTDGPASSGCDRETSSATPGEEGTSGEADSTTQTTRA